MSSSQLTTEMTKLEQAYVNIFGKKPRYMRPPYLETSGSVTSVMRTLGYNIITNDIDTGDWNGQSAAQSQAKFTQAGASGNGHIPLMHETYSSTANELTTWLINWAKTNNLKIVTVGKCGFHGLTPGNLCTQEVSPTNNGAAECLGDAGGEYQPGNFTGNGQNSC